MDRDHDHILDELLILQAQDGDMRSFSVLIKRWHPRLLRYAAHITMDAEGAKDATQEAWHVIIKGLRRLNSPHAFKTWAYRIVNNKAVDWIRKKQRDRSVQKDEMLNTPEDATGESRLGIIRMALRQLPLEVRQLLDLFYLEEYSVIEISKILQLPEGTVKSRLFYARKKLKEECEKIN